MAGTFALIALLAGADLVTDAGQGASTTHWLAEGFLLAVGLVGAAVMARGLVRLSAEADRMRADATRLAARMESTSADAARWREEAGILIQGLGHAIDRQFDRWDLSDAEKEVALLLLKGLSHRDVAGIRSTSEATTRQQARAVYRKAGVTGRNDLAAFFLEDLLLPMASAGARTQDDETR